MIEDEISIGGHSWHRVKIAETLLSNTATGERQACGTRGILVEQRRKRTITLAHQAAL
jgi:hypothetical protein